MKRKAIKAHWSLWVIVGLSFVVSAALYSKLPEQVPVHWNAAGQVDRYGSRFEGAFIMPILNAAMLLLFTWLPALDPRRDSYEKFKKFYKMMQWAMVLFLIGMQGVTLAWALGYELSISTFVKFSMGILFMVLGNYLGKVKPNWFVGIKTPWTLENEEVWTKTHRLAGPLMFLAGLLSLVLAFVDKPFTLWVIVGGLMLASFIPIVYSFVLYRQITGKSHGD
jgi:uncharacterized membrane protein